MSVLWEMVLFSKCRPLLRWRAALLGPSGWVAPHWWYVRLSLLFCVPVFLVHAVPVLKNIPSLESKNAGRKHLEENRMKAREMIVLLEECNSSHAEVCPLSFCWKLRLFVGCSTDRQGGGSSKNCDSDQWRRTGLRHGTDEDTNGQVGGGMVSSVLPMWGKQHSSPEERGTCDPRSSGGGERLQNTQVTCGERRVQPHHRWQCWGALSVTRTGIQIEGPPGRDEQHEHGAGHQGRKQGLEQSMLECYKKCFLKATFTGGRRRKKERTGRW